MITYLWISGWAVPPEWLAGQARAAFPQARHEAVSPTAAEAALAGGAFDRLGAYSLGTLWLLRQADRIAKNIPVSLLAPIFAFPAEAGLGGRIPLAQLRLQRRQLQKDPAAALADFAERSGLAALKIPVPDDEFSPAHLAELDLGLRWLESWTAPPPPPAHWRGWIGKDDALLDAAAMQQHWPNLQIVPQAGHAPGPLLQAAAQSGAPITA